jgi:RNA polymerase sigma-70 factor (ECF subfamily)
VLLRLPQLWFAADGGNSDRAMPVYFGMFADAEPGMLKRGKDIVEVYDALRPSLLAYLVGLGLVREEAEDVVQESFVRLIRHLEKHQDEQHLRPWLFRVAHNIAIDHFRSGRYRTTENSVEAWSLRDDLSDVSLNPEETLLQREQWRIAQQAIARLTPQQKYAVLLRSEGLRYREIAEVLSVGTKRAAELVQRALVRMAGGQ